MSTRCIEAKSYIKMYKVILTKELGKLCKWLRIIGFDALYYKEEIIPSLIIQALREKRTVITKRKKIDDLKVIRVRSDDVKGQIKEILTQLNISLDEERMFRRCVLCNEELEEVSPQEVKAKVPEYVFRTQNEFCHCKKCQRIYWQGTHWGNVRALLDEISRV